MFILMIITGGIKGISTGDRFTQACIRNERCSTILNARDIHSRLTESPGKA